jgi:hypothetical protein
MSDDGGGGGACSGIVGFILILVILNALSYFFNWGWFFW